MANGTEWTKSYSDHLGRNFKTTFADSTPAEPADNPSASTTYYPITAPKGSRGKPATTTDLDGITASFSYNAEGEPTITSQPSPNGGTRTTARNLLLAGGP